MTVVRSPMEYAAQLDAMDERMSDLVGQLDQATIEVVYAETALARAELVARAGSLSKSESHLKIVAKYATIDEQLEVGLAKARLANVRALMRLAEKRADHIRSNGVSARPMP